jgi:hypothetical protein
MTLPHLPHSSNNNSTDLLANRAVQELRDSPAPRLKGRADLVFLGLLVLLWTLMELLVNPIGNFPVLDDWAYGRSVQILIERGDFQLSDWTATNLFSQVLWGALFCLPGGFSFTALRLSTVLLGFLGIIASYGVIREAGGTPKLSFIGACFIAVNPIYFVLSNTFMNDVPSFALSTLSFYLYVRGIRSYSTRWIVSATVIACIGILCRQTGIAVPLAFAIGFLAHRGFTARTITTALMPAAIGGLVQFWYVTWLSNSGRMPYFFADQIHTIFSEISQGLLHTLSNHMRISAFSMIYLGFFLFPLLILLYRQYLLASTDHHRKIMLTSAPILFVLLMIPLWIDKKLMPLVGNTFIDFGVGAFGLDNTFQPGAPRIIWVLITIFGLIGAVVILQFLFLAAQRLPAYVRNRQHRDRCWLLAYALSAVILYLVPFGALGLTWRGFYDRYLLPLLPVVIVLGVVTLSRSTIEMIPLKPVLMTLTLILYGGFTVASTHDFLSANRVVWDQALPLVKHIAPDRINGGFEFNGWFRCKERSRISPDKGKNFDCLWGNQSADYMLSCVKLEGWKETKRYPFRTWLPFGSANIYVLQKTNQSLKKEQTP